MQDTLREQGIAYIDETKFDADFIKSLPQELGLTSKNGFYIHTNRFVLPIKDIQGNVLAMVGWYPDKRKYVTSNSALFSKGSMFYGMEELAGENGRVGVPRMVITEGIFDRLAVKSKGIPAVATMGINVTKQKTPWYQLFGRIVGTPDMDNEGTRIRRSDGWNLKGKGRYLEWTSEIPVSEEEVVSIKDIDNLLNLLDQGTAQELFTSAFQPSYKLIEKVEL